MHTRTLSLSHFSLLPLCSCNSDQSRCPFQCERVSTDGDCSSCDAGRRAQHRPLGRTEQLPGVRVRRTSSPTPSAPNLLSQVKISLTLVPHTRGLLHLFLMKGETAISLAVFIFFLCAAPRAGACLTWADKSRSVPRESGSCPPADKLYFCFILVSPPCVLGRHGSAALEFPSLLAHAPHGTHPIPQSGDGGCEAMRLALWAK